MPPSAWIISTVRSASTSWTIDDEHTGSGAGEHDSSRAAIPDALAGGAPAGHDCDLAGQAGIVLAIFHARFRQLPLHRLG